MAATKNLSFSDHDGLVTMQIQGMYYPAASELVNRTVLPFQNTTLKLNMIFPDPYDDEEEGSQTNYVDDGFYEGNCTF